MLLDTAHQLYALCESQRLDQLDWPNTWHGTFREWVYDSTVLYSPSGKT